ncbi:MAG: isochorismatase [Bdellovibrionales bacterium CG10_big_fil_rev_8_21_14_0_10_45_34]|nr:MAG: isochorismatase [Bdellovibrionales bacterium CG10_big_fil_rev_8_21_14_0_10_45_34]
MKAALLIIDMQKTFLSHAEALTPSLRHVCEHINHVAQHFRKRSLPVFIVQDQESCKPGHPEFEFVDLIETHETDEKIHKLHGNSFRETSLEARLKELNVDFILLTGFKAEGCVLATIHGALDRDIPFAVLRDGILSTTEDGAKFVEKTYPLMSYSVAEALLED